MTLKYVIDEETGFIKTNDEKLPMVIDTLKEDQEPYGLDGISLYAKIPSLQREAMERRKDLKTVKKELEEYQSLDLDKDNFDSWKTQADKALKTVKNLDDQKLIEADKVEEMKTQVREEALADKAKIEKQYKEILSEKEQKLDFTNKQVRELLVDNQFHSSNFIKESLVITSKMARKIFGNEYKVETIDNKTLAVGYVEKNPVMSKSDIGTYASFDESLKAMIDADPDRDSFYKVENKKTEQHNQSPVSFQANPQKENKSSVDKITAGLKKNNIS